MKLKIGIPKGSLQESTVRIFKKAGFNINNVVLDSFRMRYADGSSFLRHYFIRVAFLSAWKSIIAPERIQDFFKVLEKNLNDYASQKGELSLTIHMAYIEGKPLSLLKVY